MATCARDWLIASCFILAAVPAHAETRQFSNIVYDPPAGWETNGKDGDRLELRYDADDDCCSGCRILLDPGQAAAGPIVPWLDAAAAPDAETTIVGGPQRREDTANGRPLHALLRQVEADGRPMFQAFFAIDLTDRHELIIFEAPARDEESFNRHLATMNGDVVPMLESVRFVSEGAEPVLGAPQRGDLEGPWFGTGVRNQYNGFSGTLELVVDKRLMTFYRDGRFYDGVPPSGSGPLDVGALVAAGETRLGNYVRNGDTIELRYVDGDVSSLRMPSRNAIDGGRVTMRPAAFPPDGYRFAGVIRSMSYTALGAGIAGGVGSESASVFHEDGTYVASSFTSVSGTFDTGGGFAGAAETPETRGRYEVADGLITMTSPDGEARTSWIILEGGTEVIVGGQPVSDTDED